MRLVGWGGTQVSYSFKDYLRDRGEFIEDEEVFGRSAVTERVFREFKLGVFTMFVITLLLVTLFYDDQKPEMPETRVQEAEQPAEDSLFRQALAWIRGGQEEARPTAPREDRRAQLPGQRRAERTRLRRDVVRPKPRVKWKKYTVRRGDTLYSIARKIYRDGTKWKLILENNSDKLGKPEDLAEGMELRISMKIQG